ncbi:MAG: discoidin domain-containing protein [Myxococcaceae bacterium]
MTAVVLAPLAAFAGGATAGYAQATGYFKKDSRPTLYQPLNLLDGRDATAWCTTGSDPLNDHLTFGFKADVKIDEIKITTGNNFDEHTFAEFARAKKISLKGVKGANTFSVADQRGAQSVTFNPPLEGARFKMDVLDSFTADDIDQPVCITDVIFISEGKPLNGSWMTNKLKYDKHVQSALGTWFGGYEGNPQHFLSFFFDGTFRYTFEPVDDKAGKPKSVEGNYEITGSKLTFDIGGKKSAMRYNMDPGKRGGHQLTLDGDVPPDLQQTWRSVP